MSDNGVVTTGTTTSSPQNRKSKKTLLYLLPFVVVLALLAIYKFGIIDQASITGGCAKNDVIRSEYNAAIKTTDKERLKELASTITAEKYKNEVNCTYMLFVIEHRLNGVSGPDFSKYTDLKSRLSQGQNIDKRVVDGINRQELYEGYEFKIKNPQPKNRYISEG